MSNCGTVHRVITFLLLVFYPAVLLSADLSLAQTPDCGYDRSKPVLEDARSKFQIGDFRCTEQEINDLLAVRNLDLETKAGAHMLLAAVYYAILQDQTEKRRRVLEQFKAAYRAYRDWRGELDIQSPEFLSMLDDARREIAREDLARDTTEAVAAPPPEKISFAAVAEPPNGGGKAWYKQW